MFLYIMKMLQNEFHVVGKQFFFPKDSFHQLLTMHTKDAAGYAVVLLLCYGYYWSFQSFHFHSDQKSLFEIEGLKFLFI